MGLDLFAVQDFIESRGLCEMNMNIILDQLNNPGYKCPLKATLQPIMMQGQPMMGQPIMQPGQPMMQGQPMMHGQPMMQGQLMMHSQPLMQGQPIMRPG
jgi:hypothetical protein